MRTTAHVAAARDGPARREREFSLESVVGDGLDATVVKPGSSRQVRIAVSLCGPSWDDSQSCEVVNANGVGSRFDATCSGRTAL